MDKSNEGTTSGKRKSGRSVSGAGADEQLAKQLDELHKIHGGISKLDQERHGKHWDTDLANAINYMAQAGDSLNKYISGRRKSGKYGKDEA